MAIHRAVRSNAILKFAGGLADRQVEAIVSSEMVDRVGDIIVQRGIDYSAFMRAGGPVLWQHDSYYPVARTVRMGLVDGNLTATAQFPSVGTSEQSDECYRLIKEGVVTGTSIGFVPLKWEFLDRELGGGIRFLEVECLEYSFVSVPANSEALIIAKMWRTPAASTPPPSAFSSYAGTLQQRRAMLHWEHPEAERDAAISAADPKTRQGRIQIAAAHRRFGERMMRR
jgi:HK97 family phage prohead protease